MIYLVTNSRSLFPFSEIEYCTVENSIEMINKWNMVQYDSETTGGFN